jgi:hypothetical protein
MKSVQEFNKKWDMHKTIQEAVSKAHIEPSPETRERLVALEVNNKNIMEQLEKNQIDNEKSHASIMQSLKEFHDSTNLAIGQITDKLDKALEKKADIETQWAESFLKWAGAIIGTGLLAVVGGLIIKAIIYFR